MLYRATLIFIYFTTQSDKSKQFLYFFKNLMIRMFVRKKKELFSKLFFLIYINASISFLVARVGDVAVAPPAASPRRNA